jgi:hypothetical protein
VSSRAIGVHIDLDGTPRRIGTLWAHLNKGRESASFAYDGMFKSSVLCATNDFGQIICFEPVKGILGPVDIHRVARTIPTRWIMALKL